MKYRGGRVTIGGCTRWINPRTVYNRKREEESWIDEHEVLYDEEEEEEKEEWLLREKDYASN